MVTKCVGRKVHQGVGGRCVKPCKKSEKRVKGRCVPKKKRCTRNRVPHGVGRRCVKRCKPYERRKNFKCVRYTKPGHIKNELTNRFVKRDGAIGKWILGKGPAPSTGYGLEQGMTYAKALRQYL